MEYDDDIKKNLVLVIILKIILLKIYITQDPREKRDLLYKSFPDLK